MSDALVPVITNGGLAAVVQAQGSGLLANISHIAVGRGVINNGVGYGYIPGPTSAALQNEVIRVPILSGQVLSPAGFRVLARIPASSQPSDYIIQEIGFFLDTGVLLAVWSSQELPLAAKTALADVDLAFDLLLSQLPVTSMGITVLEPDIPDTTGVLAEQLAVQANLFSEVLSVKQRLAAAKIK